MASLEEIREERIKKLNALKSKGINSYPISTAIGFSLEEAVSGFNLFLKKKKAIVLGGRIKAIRGQGAIIFFDIYDGTGSMQGLIKKGELDDKLHALFGETVDIGDFIEIKGKLFITKRKEKTLLVSEWKILAKSLRPLPDKWHGLQDVEERFRRRYLDTLMSPEVKERFVVRSKIITALRNALNESGYLEVETPILQPLAGGALAEPFKTHHNALDIDLYLRIAPELYLKELLVGGFSKVYEIGRNFRNEGIDVTHNPEFTMLEFYESFSDAAEQRVFVEKMIKQVVKSITKKSSLAYDGAMIDFSKKWSVISYFDLLKRYALILNPESIDREELRIKANQFGVTVADKDSTEKIMDNIYKKLCRPKLIQPTFITDYPKAFSPFAKQSAKDPALIDRFQLVVGGLEMVNAFSELNDPIEQRERYMEQDKKRRGGEADVSPSDESYLEAMEYGMPPAGGVGLGVDRLIMLLTDTKNIREVILFPTLRPKQV
ncbi:MAG: lysine--tRNA ligase [bacterium]|nr:lysine--tRNA ligase [bacterium]